MKFYISVWLSVRCGCYHEWFVSNVYRIAVK